MTGGALMLLWSYQLKGTQTDTIARNVRTQVPRNLQFGKIFSAAHQGDVSCQSNHLYLKRFFKTRLNFVKEMSYDIITCFH